MAGAVHEAGREAEAIVKAKRKEPEKCECGALIVYINGERWCAMTRAKYIMRHGIPESERQPSNQ